MCQHVHFTIRYLLLQRSCLLYIFFVFYYSLSLSLSGVQQMHTRRGRQNRILRGLYRTRGHGQSALTLPHPAITLPPVATAIAHLNLSHRDSISIPPQHIHDQQHPHRSDASRIALTALLPIPDTVSQYYSVGGACADPDFQAAHAFRAQTPDLSQPVFRLAHSTHAHVERSHTQCRAQGMQLRVRAVGGGLTRRIAHAWSPRR